MLRAGKDMEQILQVERGFGRGTFYLIMEIFTVHCWTNGHRRRR